MIYLDLPFIEVVRAIFTAFSSGIIYEYVKENSKVSPEALMQKFQLSENQMTREFTVLRHCELLKATNIGGKKHFLIMEDDACRD